jgi:hypothetical protein
VTEASSALRSMSTKDLRLKRAQAEKDERASTNAGERAHYRSVAKAYSDEIARRDREGNGANA